MSGETIGARTQGTDGARCVSTIVDVRPSCFGGEGRSVLGVANVCAGTDRRLSFLYDSPSEEKDF